jgi:hypothetical protein
VKTREERQQERLRDIEAERKRIADLPLHHRHEEHRNPSYINGPWYCCAAVQLGFRSMDECDECGEPWPCPDATPNPLTAHTRAAELERDRQVAADGDDWAARELTTDDDIDEGNEG